MPPSHPPKKVVFSSEQILLVIIYNLWAVFLELLKDKRLLLSEGQHILAKGNVCGRSRYLS